MTIDEKIDRYIDSIHVSKKIQKGLVRYEIKEIQDIRDEEVYVLEANGGKILFSIDNSEHKVHITIYQRNPENEPFKIEEDNNKIKDLGCKIKQKQFFNLVQFKNGETKYI